MVFPLQAWSHNQASLRSTPSEASSSNFTVSSFSFDTPYGPSPSSLPPPPPPSPNDLTDITPRKPSLSSAYRMDNSCAFPSWPNRASLFGEAGASTGASAYISDEDLCWNVKPPSYDTIDDDEPAEPPMEDGPASLTTEEQIQLIRAAAEDEAQRMRFLAQVVAKAEYERQQRLKELAAMDHPPRLRKGKPVPKRKRRTSSRPSGRS